jgi:XTP/dITP diphosphohydrolase
MISFVTGNKGKFIEAQAIFKDLVQRNIGYTEIQTDSLEDVVSYGLKEVASRIEGPAMIEDAGLFIDGLKGFPGVYSAYVFQTLGNGGILKLMDGVKDRRAVFRSVVGYIEPGTEPQAFKGEMQGEIGLEPRGGGGFGYDPIFYVGGRTMGEMSLEEKNEISHRAQSMRALKAWLDQRR